MCFYEDIKINKKVNKIKKFKYVHIYKKITFELDMLYKTYVYLMK